MLYPQDRKRKPITINPACNAVDSHIVACTTDKPYDVHLPTNDDPYFYIRDYGTGLSNEDVKEIWCCYFNSTKRDDVCTIGHPGGFGLSIL